MRIVKSFDVGSTLPGPLKHLSAGQRGAGCLDFADKRLPTLVRCLVIDAYPEEARRYYFKQIKENVLSGRHQDQFDKVVYAGHPMNTAGRLMRRAELLALTYDAKIEQQQGLNMFVVARDGDKHLVDISGGTCTCKTFKNTLVPCVDMFIIFNNRELQLSDLPTKLRMSSHMMLQPKTELVVRSACQVSVSDDPPDDFEPTPCTAIPERKQGGRPRFPVKPSICYARRLPRAETMTVQKLTDRRNRIDDAVAQHNKYHFTELLAASLKSLKDRSVEELRSICRDHKLDMGRSQDCSPNTPRCTCYGCCTCCGR